MHFGYKHELMINIAPESIVLDILHKFLRVTDVLTDLLLDAIFTSSGFYEKTEFNSDTYLNLASLSSILQMCKLKTFTPKSTQEDIRKLFNSFQGPQKRILFEKLTTEANMNELFDKIYKINEVTKLWKCYWSIFNLLRSRFNYPNGEHIRSESKKFLDIFVSIYLKSKITPYIHLLCHHMADLYEQYGPLNYFSAQGLEKLNDLTTIQFNRSTNKHKDFARQLLEQDFRIDEYESDIV